jgi:hypothetical protein
MQTVTIRLADMSFRKTSGPSFRDELQLEQLVKSNTMSNGHVRWAVIEKQFHPKDRHCWGATTVSALRNLYKRRSKRYRHKEDEYEDTTEYKWSDANHEGDNAALLSDNDLFDDTINISPEFNGFDRALGRDDNHCDKEHMMLMYMLDDLVKGI